MHVSIGWGMSVSMSFHRCHTVCVSTFVYVYRYKYAYEDNYVDKWICM